MATRARGGGTGMAVALVVFVLLFVFALGAAIVVYTKVEAAEKTAADSKASLDIYASPEDDSKRPEVAAVREVIKKEKSNETVVARLVAENQKLRDKIAPDLPPLTATALDEFLAAKKIPKGTNLVDHIKSLEDEVVFRTQREAAEKKAKEELAVKMMTLENEKIALEEKYKVAEKDRTDKIAALAALVEANRAQSNTTFTGLQEAQTAAALAATAEAQKFADALDAKEEQIRKLQGENQKLRNILNPGGDRNTQVNPAKQIDAVILSTIPQDNLVTIDLGEKDHVLLGLTFEVFDKKTGITMEFGEARGKATIEVVKVKPNSSECRVVRSERGKPILEGDVVANLVYDKHRTFKFYVYGEFDIDNDGRSSSTDTRRIKSMIQQWGGVVADEFGYDVDFLVLGTKPVVPKAPEGSEGIRTPDEIAAEEAIRRQERIFLELQGNASLLRIPVLNQNRFLWLIGYYQR